jgi:hypothetical protein
MTNIQYKEEDGNWVDLSPHEWRVKPEVKPDITSYYYVEDSKLLKCPAPERCYDHHDLKLTFDGETGKPKSALLL